MSKIIKIGYQGIEGSNSFGASQFFVSQHFSTDNIELVPLTSSLNVTNALLIKEIDYGVVAISNSIAGEVMETKLALQNLEYEIMDRYEMSIEHLLCCKPTSSLEDIHKVISHEQALKQTENSLKALIPNVTVEAVADTALAAKMVSESTQDDTAALCNSNAAELFKLRCISKNLSDDDKNTTQFMLINL
jgi:prephenate dehydratase